MKKNNGITLIALVITMIIMLILASISVAMLSGDNSLIKEAGDAKQDADIKQEQDIINQAVYQAMNNNRFGELDATELQTIINNIAKQSVTITTSGSKLKARFTDSGRSYIIDEEGKSQMTTKVKVGDTDLSTVSDLSTKYGETVDYKSVSHPDITWQLFLTDEDNYYLIASDYVPNAELPCNGNTVNGVTYGPTDLVKVDGSDYKAKFCSNWSFNDGVLTTGTIYKNGSSSTAITRNPLTSKYLKWVNTYNTSKNNNICAVSYMMDTSKWSSFADGISGAYAIGGPTIEMLSLSWNAVDGNTQMTSYTTLDESNSNENGYVAKNPETETNFFGTSTNMWYIMENTKADGYRLVAPASYGVSWARWVSYDGSVHQDSVHNAYGFRPIVVVPK